LDRLIVNPANVFNSKREQEDTMNSPQYQKSLLTVACILLASSLSYGQHLRLRFDEVAQSADLIFIGTVDRQENRVNDSGNMAFTDVYFKDIEVLSSKRGSAQKDLTTIKLSYAGGRAGEVLITLSHAPSFTNGKRYIVFMRDDGRQYANPLIGADQGLFRVIKDSESDQQYVLTAEDRAVLGTDSDGLVLGSKRIIEISGGVTREDNEAISARQFQQSPPAAASSADSSSASVAAASTPQPRTLTVEEFVDYLKRVALRKTVEQRQLKLEGTGLFYRMRNGKIVAEMIKPTSLPPASAPFDESNPASDDLSTDQPGEQPRRSITPQGGQTGACGFHTLPLVMQQVPTSFWSYSINNDCMFVYNQFMDIYRFSESDGTFNSNNNQNEFGGFPDDATIFSVYGFHWNGALAVCMTRSFPNCGRIVESDIFWNPAYSWTNDAAFALGNRNVVLLRSVAMHELGHSWGSQIGIFKETYDYDVPTVMQPYYDSIVEDGWGLHRNDSFLLRRIYDDQRSILPTRDVGVESYYASNGLNNSFTDLPAYRRGDPITLFNVTVENNSFSALSDVRIRFFLSPTRTLSASSIQMGGSWFWTTFEGERYSVANYSTTIPANVPPGTYFIVAVVTINGFSQDDFGFNNITSFFNPIAVFIPPPTIERVEFPGGKKLTVFGQNFDQGAALFVNGQFKAAVNDSFDPTRKLFSKKGAKGVKHNQGVSIQIRNASGIFSNVIFVVRP
jgi:hypothetical protein